MCFLGSLVRVPEWVVDLSSLESTSWKWWTRTAGVGTASSRDATGADAHLSTASYPPRSCGREFVERRDGAPRAQTDATRHLLQLRHALRQKDQRRVVGRVRLPPAAIRAGPSDSPDAAATRQGIRP